jgi:hypothetical protein
MAAVSLRGALCALKKTAMVRNFDWHGARITRATVINESYRHTQNVRRFFKAQCGPAFKFDRTFMAWLKDGRTKTMGDAVEEWRRRSRAGKR